MRPVELRIENYKGFKNPHAIELRPLTVLLGANGSGKSSLLRALLLIARALVSPESREPLGLDVSGAQLGSSFIDLLHNRVTTRDLGFGVTVEGDEDEDDRIAFWCKARYITELETPIISRFELRAPWLPQLALSWSGQLGATERYVIEANDRPPVQASVSFQGFWPVGVEADERILDAGSIRSGLIRALHAFRSAFRTLHVLRG